MLAMLSGLDFDDKSILMAQLNNTIISSAESTKTVIVMRTSNDPLEIAFLGYLLEHRTLLLFVQLAQIFKKTQNSRRQPR